MFRVQSILRLIHRLIEQVNRAATRILDLMEPEPVSHRRSGSDSVPPMIFFTHHSG
jgi:hypothetical protein